MLINKIYLNIQIFIYMYISRYTMTRNKITGLYVNGTHLIVALPSFVFVRHTNGSYDLRAITWIKHSLMICLIDSSPMRVFPIQYIPLTISVYTYFIMIPFIYFNWRYIYIYIYIGESSLIRTLKQ